MEKFTYEVGSEGQHNTNDSDENSGPKEVVVDPILVSHLVPDREDQGDVLHSITGNSVKFDKVVEAEGDEVAWVPGGVTEQKVVEEDSVDQEDDDEVDDDGGEVQRNELFEVLDEAEWDGHEVDDEGH